MAKKLTRGRQKVPVAKMEMMSNVRVTFSKRRNGLFKNASELCTLTEAEIALVVFSPGQKAYSFGHLSFESVIHKYLGRNPAPSMHGTINRCVVANYHEDISEHNKKLTAVETHLKAERRCGEIFDRRIKEGQHKYWWQVPIRELNLVQLQKLEKALEDSKKKIENELHKRQIEATNTSQYLTGRSNWASGPNGFSPFGAIAVDHLATTILKC